MKNKRINLTEATAVNEVGLQDLLDLSQKVQTSVLGLQNSALKFNDRTLMQLATKLASDGGDFHKHISQLVMDAGGQSGIAQQNQDGGEEKENLSAPKILNKNDSMQQLESVKARYFKKKQLKESEAEVEQEEEEVEEETSSSEVIIDLTEPFEKVIEGLDDTEFETFKSEVVSTLEKNIDSVENKVSTPAADEFVKSVEALDASTSPEDFDFALDKLYDFADKNEIIVETVKSSKKRI